MYSHIYVIVLMPDLGNEKTFQFTIQEFKYSVCELKYGHVQEYNGGRFYLMFSIHRLLAQSTTTMKYEQLQFPLEQTKSPTPYHTKRFKVIVSVLKPGQGDIEKEDILLPTSLLKKTKELPLTQIQFSINDINTISKRFYYFKIMIGLKL